MSRRKREKINNIKGVEDFQTAFRYYRGLSGISVDDIATQSGVSVNTLRNWDQREIKRPHQVKVILKVALVMPYVDYAATDHILSFTKHPTLKILDDSSKDAEVKALIKQIEEKSSTVQLMPDTPATGTLSQPEQITSVAEKILAKVDDLAQQRKSEQSTAIVKVESEPSTEINIRTKEAQREVQTANVVHNLFERWARDLEQLSGSDETSGFKGFKLSIESALDGVGGKDERFVLEARVTSPASESDLVYTYFQRGRNYHNQGKYELALAHYMEVLQLDGNHVRSLLNRAIIFTEQKKFDLAYAEFKRAIEINPAYFDTYAELGNFYFIQNQHDLALEQLNKSVELEPNFEKPYRWRGYYHASNKKYELALADFEQAIKLAPNNASAFLYRGAVYRELENPSLALRDFNTAIKLAPDYVEAHIERGRYHYLEVDYQLALSDLTKAIELAPNNATAFYYRGLTYFNKGNLTLALHDFNKVIELAPNFGDVYYWQAQIYSAQDKNDAGETSMLRAIELGSEFALQNKNKTRNWAAVALGIKAMLKDEVLREREITILIRGKNIHDEEIYCYLKTPLKHYPIIKQMLENQERFDIRDFGEVVEAGEGEPPEEVRERMKRDFDMVPFG